MPRLRTLPLVVAFLAMLAGAPAGAATLVDCAFKGGSGDPLTRGFYVDSYDGATLSTVTLGHAAAVAGERTIALTARLNAYNGGLLGVATMTRPIGPQMSPSVFDFGHVQVPQGATIVFTQTIVAGDAAVTYDRGSGDCPGVTQTLDTTPPLSDFARDIVGLVITGSPRGDGIATTFSCPLDPLAAGDSTTRGFYVTNYGGVRLNTVSLFHRASTQQTRRLRLSARLGGFDGPLLASDTVERKIDGTRSVSLFEFGNVTVPAGATIAFVQEVVLGDNDVTHDIGFGPCADVVQVEGGVAKVDTTFRRASVGVTITGRVANPDPITIVEYFHAGFGHYFMTADLDEIAGLDAGAYGGAFVRTGQVFKARDGPAAGALAVCRFFTVAFAPKSSHFYTADPVECAGLRSNPAWQYEKIAFYIAAPKGQACAGDLRAVSRLYNDGMTGAPNHRFTTSQAIIDDFVANLGWTPEGVRFCAPL